MADHSQLVPLSKRKCHGNRKLQHFKRKCRARSLTDQEILGKLGQTDKRKNVCQSSVSQAKPKRRKYSKPQEDKIIFYKPSKYLKMPKKLLLQSLRLQLNCPLKKRKEQQFILMRLRTVDQRFCLDQLHQLYWTYYEQGVQSQVWLDEIIQIVDSNQPEIIQQYLHEYTALLQNKIHEYQSDLDGQRMSTVPSLEFIDYRLSEFVRLHHRDLIRAIQLKKNQLTTHIAITRLSKQIASFKLTDQHNQGINRLIDIRKQQLKTFEELTLFEQDILCHQLSNETQRQQLYLQLEQYETKIEHYEQAYQKECQAFQSEIQNVKHCNRLIHTVKNYIYYQTQQLLYSIRYKESCRLVKLKHRYRHTRESALTVYPQIIVDVPKVPFNRLQLEYLSRTGPNYIRPNQSYIFGSKRREQVIHDEHKQIMTPLTCHLIRYHHIPNTATIVKTISDRLQVYLRRCYTMPLSYLNIYRVRKEFKLMKAIRYRLKKGNYILRTSDKSGIFHLGHVKDYKRKAQAYQERTQAYVELTGDNLLSVIFRKFACLLNELRSKKHIQAGQLERMMPKFDTVSLGYLYFIPKPHKEGTPLRPIVSSMNTPTTGISKFLDELLRPLFDKHVRATTIIDGVDLIHRLEAYIDNDYLKPTTQFCTFDITDLYTMLPQEESLDVLTEFLLENDYHKVQNVPIDAIRKLARIVLTENVFIYDKKYYRQVLGGAMGSAFTLTLANIFMWKWEKQLVQRLHASNEIYGRYIDDIFFTSNESLDTIHQMLDEANHFHSNIKLVRQIGTHVSFLDLSIENQNGQLVTSVYHKETAEPYTVPFTSDHPRHIFTNIIDNALLRAIRYSSTLTAFNREQRLIKLLLLYNGYPPRYIHNRFNKFFHSKLCGNSILSLFQTESIFQLIRFNLLNKPTLAELQIVSRIAKVTDSHDHNVFNVPTSHKEQLIIHYTHERRFKTFKRDLHHIWNEVVQSTPLAHTKLIIGHRNPKNATQELVRRQPYPMPKLVPSMLTDHQQSDSIDL